MISNNQRMFIQVIVLVVLAIIITFTRSYVAQGIHALLAMHDWLNRLFGSVFSGGRIGNIIQDCLSFIILPFVIAGVIAVIYGIIKKSFLPCFMLIVWFVWLVMVTGILMR